MSGKLVTFEGVEGSGKSTVIQSIASMLEAQGLNTVVTREPGATALGQQIRQLLLHEMDYIAERAELFLYLADRADHIASTIQPALDNDSVVLCDRFTDSTIAYQGYGRMLSIETVTAACAFAQNVDVDRTYLLDIDPVTGLTRAKNRGQGQDRLEREKIEFHQRIRDGYLTLAQQNPDRIVVVDAGCPASDVADQVAEDLASFLQINRP